MVAVDASPSWSHTRHQTLLGCARRYYWRYLVPGGWAADDPPLAREVFLLKHLTNLYAVLGISIHNLARECALRIRRGEPVLAEKEILHRVRQELNRVCLSSQDRGAFLRYPAREPMLQDVWLRGERDPRTDARVRERMYACAANLAQHEIWAELERGDRSSIVAVDSLRTFALDGITVFAAPDLVYSPRSGDVVIADWKSGGGAEDDHMPQLANYALFVREGLGFPWAERRWQGRIMDLVRGEDLWYDLTDADLEAARRRIRQGVALMREMDRAAGGSVAPDPTLFPVLPPDRRSACPGCPFLSLCADELAASAVAAPSGPGEEVD